MGTVGLSFGSPLSGSGINVSSTVSSILVNLQNVETPWKTQISSIDSQDTVLSSLGTLMSTLTTDMTNLTDATGVLSLKTGSSSNTDALDLTAATSSAVAGTHTVEISALAATDSGVLTTLKSSSDTLSGSIVIQVGTGATQTIALTSSDNTLSGLASAINTAGIGVTASVLTDSSGSRLSLVSGTSGAAGVMTISSALTDTAVGASVSTLTYKNTVAGADGSITVDGVELNVSSNTVSDLIPGITFDLLATTTSSDPIQVVIGNDNSDVVTAVNTLVTDYNSLISAINVQEGKDASGNNEPLFGSPTLSLLQQDILNGISSTNPNGYLDGISTSGNSTLSGSITIGEGTGAVRTFVIGAGTNTTNTFYTGTASGYNTLTGLTNAINAAVTGLTLKPTITTGTSTVTSSATLTAVDSSSDILTGSLTLGVGGGTTKEIIIGASPGTSSSNYVSGALYTGSGVNTLSGLASYITSEDIGITASVVTASSGAQTLSLTSGTSGSSGTLSVNSNLVVGGFNITPGIVTSNGDSTLTLTSGTAGTSGALAVKSSLSVNNPTKLTFTNAGTDSTEASGTLGSVATSTATLAGSITIQVGTGSTNTITLTSSDNTLSGLASAINSAEIGVTAAVETVSGVSSVYLVSQTSGTTGSLTISSAITDVTDKTASALNYNFSSNVTSMSLLGISVNSDGTLSYDAASLDSLLDSDFSGVQGLFQNANSWGAAFSNVLNNAGSSSSTGIVKLATNANSSIESTLNADISREDMLISSESKSMTTELNSVNEVLQELPSELSQVNELYSAITGYNQSSS